MSNLLLARKITCLHPAALTVGWLVVSVTSTLVPLSPLSHVLTLALITLICGWTWAVYTVSVAITPAPIAPRWTPWLFLAPPLLAVIAEVAHLSMDNTPLAFAFFAFLFFALWRSAQALLVADPQGGPATAGRVFGTMMLFFFGIVGVWVLRPRILRVARPATV